MSSLAALPPPSPSPTALVDIVARIGRHDPTGMADLYRLCSDSVRYSLVRDVGFAANDLLHDSLLDVVKAIHAGHVREPRALMGYVNVITRRKAMRYNGFRARDRLRTKLSAELLDRDCDIEQQVIRKEEVSIMTRLLLTMPERDREVLTRFYLYEQRPQQIQDDLSLTPTQYRLLKSRAKARFVASVRQRLKATSLGAVPAHSDSPTQGPS